MDSITLCTAEAYALRADTSPNVTRCRVCSEGNEGRFAAVVLPYLADAYALARWLTSNHGSARGYSGWLRRVCSTDGASPRIGAMHKIWHNAIRR
jgi:hypothetical protein